MTICKHCGRCVDTTNGLIGNDDLDELVRIAGRLFYVAPDNILSPSRKRAYVAVRQAIWVVMRTRWRMTLQDIADVFDRDHTTILHGIRVADPIMVDQLDDAAQHLYAPL